METSSIVEIDNIPDYLDRRIVFDISDETKQKILDGMPGWIINHPYFENPFKFRWLIKCNNKLINIFIMVYVECPHMTKDFKCHDIENCLFLRYRRQYEGFYDNLQNGLCVPNTFRYEFLKLDKYNSYIKKIKITIFDNTNKDTLNRILKQKISAEKKLIKLEKEFIKIKKNKKNKKIYERMFSTYIPEDIWDFK